MNGIQLIKDERNRQVEKEGWTDYHDDKHNKHELEDAGDAYLANAFAGRRAPMPKYWPWESVWWKPDRDPIRNFQKAGALYLAEIDRNKRSSKPDASVIEWLTAQVKKIANDIDIELEKRKENAGA